MWISAISDSFKLELTDAALDVGVIAPGPVPSAVDGRLIGPSGGVAPSLGKLE